MNINGINALNAYSGAGKPSGALNANQAQNAPAGQTTANNPQAENKIPADKVNISSEAHDKARNDANTKTEALAQDGSQGKAIALQEAEETLQAVQQQVQAGNATTQHSATPEIGGTEQLAENTGIEKSESQGEISGLNQTNRNQQPVIDLFA